MKKPARFLKKNIKVGQKYSNKNFPGVVYLGVGDFNYQSTNFRNKQLIIIKDIHSSECLGHIVTLSNHSFFTNAENWEEINEE